ncbi:exodeoxyribonuclease VII large subunit [Veillonella rodentium]|uniref:Exodeoxyribonuclease 7 large subunit n=1 Tax=Veillonella rodentium TaxID=248315 RepID=A0A239Z2Q5_9FIRM|nr:exodeoxyribonuclease VII large subunit [Veillonella rodentium]SNV64906.1 Exodeoxyribonuclease 7 large subunit [Veillonella rodentium]
MNVLTITQLNNLIKRTLDREYLLKNVYVSGTIINAKRHSSGHMYFSLKDEESAIDVTMWSSTVMQKGLASSIQNGLLVTVKASVNFYNKMGRLNLIASDMQIGEKSPLQLEFDALKKELTALGYFDDSHKQPLPYMAKCIGIVTSQSGAVLHDILYVSKKRNPLVQFKLYSVPVQGPAAGPVIAKGIAAADADPDVNVIIVGRGGGSMEDLWCFNDRAVVEAIYKAHTPIISAVGHETDYTLCDYAADVRGATPSHAAELSVLPLTTLQEQLLEKEEFLHQFIQYTLQQKRTDLTVLFNRKLGIPALQFLHKQKTLLQQLSQSMNTSAVEACRTERHNLALLAQQMESLNPLHMMLKGYAKVEHKGQSVTSVSQVQPKDNIRIILSDGNVSATIKEVHIDERITEKL